MALKTDYKDALYDGQRRYRIIQNEDGTYSLPDSTTYTQAGDKFGANDINSTNEAVNKLYRTVILTLPSSGWSTTSPYTLTMEVPGIKIGDPAELWSAIDSNTSAADAKAWKKMAGMIDRADILENGKMSFTCLNKKPVSDFKVKLKGVSV